MVTKRVVSVMGSTGSIGVSTLDVIGRHRDRYDVYALAAYASVDTMVLQCLAFSPRFAVMVDEAAATALREQLPAELGTEVLSSTAYDFAASTTEPCHFDGKYRLF